MNKIILEKNYYNCQLGMYFDGIKKLSNGFVVYSNFVKDKSWNYFTGFTSKDISNFQKNLDEAEKFLTSKDRQLCFALSPSTKINKKVYAYITANYQKYGEEIVLLCKKIKKIQKSSKDYSFKKIDNKTQKDLFIKTFKICKTQTSAGDTYPSLSEDYFFALEHSFKHVGSWEFSHYLSFYKNKPIGMVSVCSKGKFCGIYGAGTLVQHRKKGVFSNLFKYVYDEQSLLGRKYFFCSTKRNSGNHKFYNKLGFKDKYVVELWEQK